MAQIADAGVALEREESVAGLTCIAAPVIVGERVVAAISIAGPLYRFSPELHRATITAAAGAIGGLLAGRVARLTTTPK